MKIYGITIRPLSGFCTPLKADTLFGHFCWQVCYDSSLVGLPLDGLLRDYDTKPPLVFSSAYLVLYWKDVLYYVLRRPALPAEMLKEGINEASYEERKEFKRKKWMLLNPEEGIRSFKNMTYINEHDLSERLKKGLTPETKREIGEKVRAFTPVKQPHNTINRLTGRTGEDMFAPFVIESLFYLPETELVIFTGIDENRLDIEKVCRVIERIGEVGFGRDASIGMGRFEVCSDPEEIDLHSMGSETPNACYTLGPSVPQKDGFGDIYAMPFVRFGKHGDVLARSKNPFKNPVIMADEGAVLKVRDKSDIFDKPYIGTSLRGLSLAFPDTVGQGYSLYIPVKVEDEG